jgi:hypothetical protein
MRGVETHGCDEYHIAGLWRSDAQAERSPLARKSASLDTYSLLEVARRLEQRGHAIPITAATRCTRERLTSCAFATLLGGEAQPLVSVSPCDLGRAGCLTDTVAIYSVSSSPISRGHSRGSRQLLRSFTWHCLRTTSFRARSTPRKRPARPLPPWSSRSASPLAA